MKVFVDEDTGASLGKALVAIGVEAYYVSNSKHNIIKGGTTDDRWLPVAGARGWLVISRNIRIIQNDAERDLITAHAVGIVSPSALPPNRTPSDGYEEMGMAAANRLAPASAFCLSGKPFWSYKETVFRSLESGRKNVLAP